MKQLTYRVLLNPEPEGGFIKIRLDKPRDGTEQWPKKVGNLDDNDVPF